MAMSAPIGRITPVTKADPEEIKMWLEWAGMKLLCMGLPSAYPQAYRSFWPDYPNDAAEGYGYTAETMRAPKVTPFEVPVMETILRLPGLATDPIVRRILHKRALVAPLSGHYVNSYVRIAQDLNIDRRLAARLFVKGTVEVAKRTPRTQAYSLRHFLSAYPHMTLTTTR